MTPTQIRMKMVRHKARQLFPSGQSDREIADAVGINRQSISKMRREMGFPLATEIRRAEDDQIIRDMSAKGFTDTEIGLTIGQCRQYIGKRRRELGLPSGRPFVPLARPDRETRLAKCVYDGLRKPSNPLPKEDLHAKVHPICAALGNVYTRAPDADIQGAVAVAMRALHTDPAFARAWREVKSQHTGENHA